MGLSNSTLPSSSAPRGLQRHTRLANSGRTVIQTRPFLIDRGILMQNFTPFMTEKKIFL